MARDEAAEVAIDERGTEDGEGKMNARRVSEIESSLREAIPHEVYQPDLEPVLYQQCGGATDDHKANCFVPLVYELLDDVKRRTKPTKEREG